MLSKSKKIELETRKQEAEAYFDAHVKTGNYTVYEEYEYKKPIEGLTEEPVVEEIIVVNSK